jgi:hypothetical protein
VYYQLVCLGGLPPWGGYWISPVSNKLLSPYRSPWGINCCVAYFKCNNASACVFCRMKNSVNMSALLEYMKKDASYRYVGKWCTITA